ncbi:hypothetical protein [Rhizobium sp. CG5]|uniref:hypothetical protein n=1 Tax=Rhizobium sp. CG5 TaxID=2726076 RepID=UPI002033B1C3|nr:hypothetical protein [Rhizobium sp. CG5]
MKTVVSTCLAAMRAVSLAHAADKPISFEDYRGQKIELAAPPERLATIIRAAPFIYYLPIVRPMTWWRSTRIRLPV